MGSKILYYIVIKPVSLLPYFLLYRLSDFMFFLMYYLIGYRKKVIIDNIYSSFPDKDEVEKGKIVKKFYRHFCDLIVEAVKNFSVSPKQIEKRMKFENIEVLNKYFDLGKSVVTIGGHYGNWEMFAVGVGKVSKLKQYAIYKPLSNSFFDDKMKKSRGFNGLSLIPMKETKAHFREERKEPITIIFGSDQWPSNPKRAFWTTFLGRETPFLFGAEKYAKEFDWPVVYCELIREKRGHFIAKYHELTNDPTTCKEGEITEKFVTLLEKTIEKDPAYWLWSHRRWKRSKDEVFETNNA